MSVREERLHRIDPRRPVFADGSDDGETRAQQALGPQPRELWRRVFEVFPDHRPALRVILQGYGGGAVANLCRRRAIILPPASAKAVLADPAAQGGARPPGWRWSAWHPPPPPQPTRPPPGGRPAPRARRG